MLLILITMFFLCDFLSHECFQLNWDAVNKGILLREGLRDYCLNIQWSLDGDMRWENASSSHRDYIKKGSSVLSSEETCADNERSQWKIITNTSEQIQPLHCNQNFKHWLKMKTAIILNLCDNFQFPSRKEWSRKEKEDPEWPYCSLQLPERSL